MNIGLLLCKSQVLLTGSVTLGKLFDISEPWIPPQYNHSGLAS
jgi:hypothetical protein